MEITFEPGDIVKLKSGGPRMTIAVVKAEIVKSLSKCICYWFDDLLSKQEALFVEETLEPVK